MSKPVAGERLSWTLIAILALSCAMLAFLQYRWTGEISGAERDQMRQTLVARMSTFSRAVDTEIASVANALVPEESEIERLGREAAWRARYSHSPLFTGVSVMWADGNDERRLLRLEPAGQTQGEIAPSGIPGPRNPNTLILDAPGPPPQPQVLVLELNIQYLRTSVLPRLLSLYLGEDGTLEYDAEISARDVPGEVIFTSAGADAEAVRAHADASLPMLNVRLRNGPPGGGGPGGFPFGGRRGPPPGSPPPGGRGRRGGPPPQGMWQLSVRHHAGSLEAVVSRAQMRNLAVSGAVLVLILATSGLLLLVSRRVQRLADLQMEFVAGVSHELRTPLTVIRTAAYNLRDAGLRSRPEHVERYGRLIESESTRLESLMEQVLRFASLNAGQPLLSPEPVALEEVCEEEVALRRDDLERAGFEVVEQLGEQLPLVQADPGALRHAVRNLIDNAIKHAAHGKWICLQTRALIDGGGNWVELRVADHGPGIPRAEQRRIFEAFSRGGHALNNQVGGSGLGLSLVRMIAERHGGSVRVESPEGGGAEFILRLPA